MQETQGTRVQFPGRENPTSSVLAWKNAMDRGAWWAAVHGVTESQTWLNTQAHSARLTWKWKSLSGVQLFAIPWTVVHGILQARILEWVAFPFSRRSPQPRIETRSPALPAEPQGKPKNIGVGSVFLLQWIFLTQELNRSLLHWPSTPVFLPGKSHGQRSWWAAQSRTRLKRRSTHMNLLSISV